MAADTGSKSTPTPRTDAHMFWAKQDDAVRTDSTQVVDYEFARTLERELEEFRGKLAEQCGQTLAARVQLAAAEETTHDDTIMIGNLTAQLTALRLELEKFQADSMAQYKRAESAEARLRECERDVERLRATLWDAIECVEDWGAYASEYFQNKHRLNDDIARLKAAWERK